MADTSEKTAAYKVKNLLANLHEGNSVETTAALASLGEPAIGALISSFKPNAPLMHSRAIISALAKISPEHADNFISDFFFNKDEAKNEIAITAIADNRISRYTQFLAKIAWGEKRSHDEEYVPRTLRILSAKALAKMDDLESLEYLVNMYDRVHDYDVKEFVSAHLDTIFPITMRDIQEGLYAWESSSAPISKRNEAQTTRNEMSAKLASFGAKGVLFIKHFIRECSTRDAEKTAMNALEQVTDPAAIPLLAACIKDSSGVISRPAKIALKRFGKEALPALLELLKTDPHSLEPVLEVLSKIESPIALDIILAATGSESPGLRAAAISALCCKGPENIGIAIRALDDPAAPVVEAAALGLAENGYIGAVLTNLRKKMRDDPTNRVKYGELADKAANAASNSKKASTKKACAPAAPLEGIDFKRFPMRPAAFHQIRKKNLIRANAPAVV